MTSKKLNEYTFEELQELKIKFKPALIELGIVFLAAFIILLFLAIKIIIIH